MKSCSLSILLAATLIAGCSGQFWGGVGSGALGAGAAYEVSGQKQLHDLEQERKEGKISQQEYEIRKDQIERGHLIK